MYSFTAVPRRGGGVDIELTQQATGKIKHFFLAGCNGITTNIIRHMRTLTEQQCEDFFTKAKR